MMTLKNVLYAGLLGLALSSGTVSAQGVSLFDVAMSGARVDRSDPDAVRAVQRDLRALGFYAGPIDGVFGPLTYAAAVAAVEAANQETLARQERSRASRSLPLNVSEGEGGDGPSAAAPGPVGLSGAGGAASASTGDGAVASGSGGATAGAGPSEGGTSVGASAGPADGSLFD